jgi:hypothetical protein
VQVIRQLLAQRHLATLLCAAALLLKLAVPTGYMIASVEDRITVAICSGTVPAPAPMRMAMPGMHGAMPDHGTAPDHGGTTDHGKAELPCAFAGLSAAATGAIDPVQLAALVAFILALGLLATVLPAVTHPAYLRPPLRGPPAYR